MDVSQALTYTKRVQRNAHRMINTGRHLKRVIAGEIRASRAESADAAEAPALRQELERWNETIAHCRHALETSCRVRETLARIR